MGNESIFDEEIIVMFRKVSNERKLRGEKGTKSKGRWTDKGWPRRA